MFDDLRNSSENDSSFFQDDELEIDPLLEKKPKKPSLGGLKLNIKFNSKNFLGMNAFQRFIISLLLLMVICILGSMLMMITGSFSLF